ncbi:MAG: bifunctional riboflavin kinase/FAD synthetase [Polaromonas sp.]|nr:bifunctional riboflavin kinase/FAD synthetase [Gemmatimonadaceae bacterium]
MLPPHIGETVVTVGTFDGVHLGHLDVLVRLAARAKKTGRTSLLLTFEPHPLEFLKPDKAPLLLTTREEKLGAMATTGLDYVAILPFTRALAEHSAEEFVDLVLLGRFRMAELLIGHDHGFGRGRAGDVDTLRTLGVARGFAVDVVEPVETPDGLPVSSTRIRAALLAGDLATAEAGLGRRYAVAGHVVSGAGRGRELGYPTLNVMPESPRKLLPPDGVYAVEVDTPRGRYGGMMNLGGRPTFGDERRAIEAHLFAADGGFYGDAVQVGFVARLRETRRFAGPEALIEQLAADEVDARRALTLLAESAKLKGSMHFPPSTP